jgi:hypothetical protein
MAGPTTGPTSFRLRFSRTDEVLPGLEDAVQTLMGYAMQDCSCGILIVRHSPGDYTVTLDRSVKFGETVTRIAE